MNLDNVKNDVNPDEILLAAVEGGGTTFVLSIAQVLHKKPTADDDASDILRLTPTSFIQIVQSTTIPSSSPEITLQNCAAWLSSHRPSSSNGTKLAYAGVGVGCFGPLGLKSNSPFYGCILPSTPKKEWRGVDILTPILRACSGEDGDQQPPFRLDTDVNAPALAEYKYLTAEKNNPPISSLAYITVGTGVGVGLIINNKPVHGFLHPEGGHLSVSPLAKDPFPGYSWGRLNSPYRGVHTVEGIASSVALSERLGLESREDLGGLADDHEVWDHAANALADLCVSLVLMVSVEGIVLGGGVMKRRVLYGKIRRRVEEILNGYVDLPSGDVGREFIRESEWGDRAGLVGAIVLAKEAYEEGVPGGDKVGR